MSDEVNVNVVETPAAEATTESKIEAVKNAYAIAKVLYDTAKAAADKEADEFMLTLISKYDLRDLNAACNEAQKELHTLMVSNSGEFATSLWHANSAAKNARAELAAVTKVNAEAKSALKLTRESMLSARKAHKDDKKNADLKKAFDEAKARLAAEEVARKIVRSRLKAAKSAALSAANALAMLKKSAP